MEIRIDDLTGPGIRALLEAHLAELRTLSPPGSVHALEVDRLRGADISFWSAWEGESLVGCGALRELGPTEGEVKSMRTAAGWQRRGVARAILGHLLEEARRRGYRRLSLETGSMAAFEPARRLYASVGFRRCGPFGAYVDDPNNVWMTLEL